MRGIWLAGAALVAGAPGCYAPSPPTGAPCSTGVCPAPLVCSPATLTCEHDAVALDAALGDAARDAAAVDAPLDGAPADAAVDAMPTPFDPLSGAQWLLPCTGLVPPQSCACGSASSVIQLTDASPRHFDVTVRIRGVVEGGRYTGGASPQAFWYVGGTPADALRGVYELDVSSPPQHYYLNFTNLDGIHVLDYTVTLPIDTDATLTLTSDGQDGRQRQNLGPDGLPIVIPGVTTTPSPYDGEFAQLDVVSATQTVAP